MAVGAELAKRLGIFILGNLIIWGGIKIVENKLDGKTAFGKKIADRKEKTYVDWRGNIILGTRDGWVE